MASTSQIVVLRLRSGGLLVVAPATALPWPRVLGRKLRRLQEVGLRMAAADPHAMARLRDELPRLTNEPIARGAAPLDSGALVAALLAGVRSERLTLLYGHGESTLREGRAGELGERFGASIGGGAPTAIPDAAEGPPSDGTPLPYARADRLHWMCARAPAHLFPPLDVQMLEFFSERQSALTAELLTLWSETLDTNTGHTVDAGMFATAAWRLGAEAPVAFDALGKALTLAASAADWPTLDVASQALASGAGGLGPSLFRQFLRRLGDRHGAAGQSVGGEEDGAGA